MIRDSPTVRAGRCSTDLPFSDAVQAPLRGLLSESLSGSKNTEKFLQFYYAAARTKRQILAIISGVISSTARCCAFPVCLAKIWTFPRFQAITSWPALLETFGALPFSLPPSWTTCLPKIPAFPLLQDIVHLETFQPTVTHLIPPSNTQIWVQTADFFLVCLRPALPAKTFEQIFALLRQLDAVVASSKEHKLQRRFCQDEPPGYGPQRSSQYHKSVFVLCARQIVQQHKQCNGVGMSA